MAYARHPSDMTQPVRLLPMAAAAYQPGATGAPATWQHGRYTFTWQKRNGMGVLSVTGIPNRALPYVMSIDSEQKARSFTPRLASVFDAGRIPVEGTFRRLEDAGAHTGAMVAMTKGISTIGEEGMDDDDPEGIAQRREFQGIPLRIEFPAGTVREGVGDGGVRWSKDMLCDYGEVDGAFRGVDGDRVDVYVGDDDGATMVYVIDQMDPVSGDLDEQKVMLGFPSRESAREMYLRHVPANRFGRIVAFPMASIKRWLQRMSNSGEPISKGVPTEATPAISPQPQSKTMTILAYEPCAAPERDGPDMVFLLKAVATMATVAPMVPESIGGPVRVRGHEVLRRSGTDPRYKEVRYRPPSQRRRPTILPSAMPFDEGKDTPTPGYLIKGGWSYRESRLAKSMARGRSEDEAMERMRARWERLNGNKADGMEQTQKGLATWMATVEPLGAFDTPDLGL